MVFSKATAPGGSIRSCPRSVLPGAVMGLSILVLDLLLGLGGGLAEGFGQVLLMDARLFGPLFGFCHGGVEVVAPADHQRPVLVLVGPNVLGHLDVPTAGLYESGDPHG